MATNEEFRRALAEVQRTASAVEIEIEAIGAALADRKQTLDAIAGRLGQGARDVGRTASQSGDAVVGVTKSRTDRLRALVLIDNMTDGARDAATSSARELQQALFQLRQNADDAVEATRDALLSYGDDTEKKIDALRDFITEELEVAIEEALAETLSDLRSQIEELPGEVVSIIEGEFEEVLTKLRGNAEERIGEVRNRVADMTDRLQTKVEDTGRALFEDEIRELGETVIARTMQEVVDDVVMTQISAQLTGMLSGYLPQLVVAKNVVGAVRRALEIMRAGF